MGRMRMTDVKVLRLPDARQGNAQSRRRRLPRLRRITVRDLPMQAGLRIPTYEGRMLNRRIPGIGRETDVLTSARKPRASPMMGSPIRNRDAYSFFQSYDSKALHSPPVLRRRNRRTLPARHRRRFRNRHLPIVRRMIHRPRRPSHEAPRPPAALRRLPRARLRSRDDDRET